ncbi:unnamed protein product [Clavelina lepadiformis]|uniref:Uncharacterized protein n=1 Tax=Clavelina lepadiformis TaxID=159417 RepID=A0ABP0GDI9_CLALP
MMSVQGILLIFLLIYGLKLDFTCSAGSVSPDISVKEKLINVIEDPSAKSNISRYCESGQIIDNDKHVPGWRRAYVICKFFDPDAIWFASYDGNDCSYSKGRRGKTKVLKSYKAEPITCKRTFKVRQSNNSSVELELELPVGYTCVHNKKKKARNKKKKVGLGSKNHSKRRNKKRNRP